ncbi:MAG: cupin domain-containing protein [Pseudomonadota bacterium]
MNRNKPHIEMAPIDLSGGWHPLAGAPAGLEVKLLADDLDEDTGSGARTRLVRFAPGAATTVPFTHSYWEEVYLLSGDMSDLARQSRHEAPVYSCRPPGTAHGPFSSSAGCLLFEIQYYRCESPPVKARSTMINCEEN